MQSAATGGPGPGPTTRRRRWPLLVGSDRTVPCLDGVERRAVELDQAASTQAHPAVADRVGEFLPWYSSVHRGAGFRSRRATHAYEEARRAVLAFAGRDPEATDVAILCRNTTEAINHLAYRLRLDPSDVVVTTVVEHHANLLPWGRVADAPVRGVRRRRDLRRGRRDRRPRRRSARPGAAGRHRRVERDRVAAAPRGDHRRRTRPGRAGAGRCRAAGAAPPPARRRRLPGLQWTQALRPVRRRRPDRPPRGSSRRATRSWPAAGRWTWWASTR